MDKRVEKAYDLIKRRSHEKMLLEDIAANVGLSPYHFQRLFRQEMKESPSACLNRIRLERSAHLLRSDTNWNLSEVAAQCGFSSLSTFSRAFSKKFGRSPKAWLKEVPSIRTAVEPHPQSPPPRGVIRIRQSDIDALKVEVVYQPDLFVFYNQTSISSDDFMKAFDRARSFCELNKIAAGHRKIGIITHVTFHHPEADLNYAAGVDLLSHASEKISDRVYHLPKGRYATFTTNQSVKLIQEVMMTFKIGWLDKSEFVRRDLFGFEEIFPENKTSDYPFIKRKIWVPLVRKTKG